MSNWFLIRNGKQHGPITDQQLKDLAANGRIQPTDQVRRQDMTAPVLAGAIKGLFTKVVTAPTPPPLPEPAASKPSFPWQQVLRVVLPVGAVLVALAKYSFTKPKQMPPVMPPAPVAQQASAPPKIELQRPEPASAPEKQIPFDMDLSKGRPQIGDFIELIKLRQRLELHGETGQEAAGTPFEFFNDQLGTNCRIYVGGRELYAQNVSAILVEANEQLAALVLATPLDLKEGIRRGNDVASIGDFMRSVLPDVNVRKIVGDHSVALGSGGEATESFGKASLSMKINKFKREMTIVITVDQ